MSELRKANTNSAYFVTFTVVGWIDVFTRHDYADEIIKNLLFAQENRGIEIYAYVIMSNHIHLVVRHEEELLAQWIRDFKSFAAKKIIKLIEENPKESRKEWMLYMFKHFAKKQKQNSTYQFWQKTNHPVLLFSSDVIDQKIDYIHNNPVRSNLVRNAEDYYYSSANPVSKIKVLMA